MLSLLDSIRRGVERTIKEIEDKKLRDYARSFHIIAQYGFILLLFVIGASVVGKFLDVALQAIKLAASVK